MDRNDQVLFSAFGAVLVAVLVWAVIGTFGDSPTASAWTQSILTVAAIVVAIALPIWSESQRSETQHRIAEVTVASKLRSWLRVAAEDVIQNQRYENSQGTDGVENIDIPRFGITANQVAAMRPQYAREVLAVMERRERRQSDIYSTRFYHDEDDARMEYYEQIAHLFWSVRRIYQEIARDRGLEEFTNRKSEVASIKRVAERAEEHFKAQENEA